MENNEMEGDSASRPSYASVVQRENKNSPSDEFYEGELELSMYNPAQQVNMDPPSDYLEFWRAAAGIKPPPPPSPEPEINRRFDFSKAQPPLPSSPWSEPVRTLQVVPSIAKILDIRFPYLDIPLPPSILTPANYKEVLQALTFPCPINTELGDDDPHNLLESPPRQQSTCVSRAAVTDYERAGPSGDFEPSSALMSPQAPIPPVDTAVADNNADTTNNVITPSVPPGFESSENIYFNKTWVPLPLSFFHKEMAKSAQASPRVPTNGPPRLLAIEPSCAPPTLAVQPCVMEQNQPLEPSPRKQVRKPPHRTHPPPNARVLTSSAQAIPPPFLVPGQFPFTTDYFNPFLNSIPTGYYIPRGPTKPFYNGMPVPYFAPTSVYMPRAVPPHQPYFWSPTPRHQPSLYQHHHANTYPHAPQRPRRVVPVVRSPPSFPHMKNQPPLPKKVNPRRRKPELRSELHTGDTYVVGPDGDTLHKVRSFNFVGYLYVVSPLNDSQTLHPDKKESETVFKPWPLRIAGIRQGERKLSGITIEYIDFVSYLHFSDTYIERLAHFLRMHQQSLECRPYWFRVCIKSKTQVNTVIRLFIGPQLYDQSPINLEELSKYFVECDSFHFRLEVGWNDISRQNYDAFTDLEHKMKEIPHMLRKRLRRPPVAAMNPTFHVDCESFQLFVHIGEMNSIIGGVPPNFSSGKLCSYPIGLPMDNPVDFEWNFDKPPRRRK